MIEEIQGEEKWKDKDGRQSKRRVGNKMFGNILPFLLLKHLFIPRRDLTDTFRILNTEGLGHGLDGSRGPRKQII